MKKVLLLLMLVGFSSTVYADEGKCTDEQMLRFASSLDAVKRCADTAIANRDKKSMARCKSKFLKIQDNIKRGDRSSKCGSSKCGSK